MNITFNHNVTMTLRAPELLNALTNIAAALMLNARRTQNMAAELDDLVAQVKANSTIVESAVTLIHGIADRITAAGTDPAALVALTNELRAEDRVLSDAISANTPGVAPTTGASPPTSSTVPQPFPVTT